MRTTSFFLCFAMLGLNLLRTSEAQAQETSLPAKSPASQKAESQKTTSGEKADSGQIEVPQITEERPMSFWMAKKLDYSKSILEALTTGDFDRLVVDAERLRVLGKLEGFVRNRNADYRIQMNTFDLATRELVSSAKRKRAEGASLAFNHLTNSCVNCHQLLREGVE